MRLFWARSGAAGRFLRYQESGVRVVGAAVVLDEAHSETAVLTAAADHDGLVQADGR